MRAAWRREGVDHLAFPVADPAAELISAGPLMRADSLPA
jgi:hypothetical protein